MSVASSPTNSSTTVQSEAARMLHLQATELPEETLARALSFVLRSSQCLREVGAVNRLFHDVSSEALSWQGSSVCISPDDIELLQGSHYAFENLIPKWSFIEELFVNFEDAHAGERRRAARKCWQALADTCFNVTCLCLRNWHTFEPLGLPALTEGFPKLRHLEINNCGQISSYSLMVPVFEKHPSLLSLRATFQPNATAGADFASAAPRTLMALGFVNIESAHVLALLFQRCQLQHFWLSANSSFRPFQFRFNDEDDSTTIIKHGLSKVRTLSLPSALSENACAGIITHCSAVELVCRMRITTPAFGAGALSHDFEPLPESGGVVIRRQGSCAQLEDDKALWKPYSQDETCINAWSSQNGNNSKREKKRARPSDTRVFNRGRELQPQKWPCKWQQDHLKAIADELAEAAARMRQSR